MKSYKIKSPCRYKCFKCLRSATITAACYAGRLAFEYGDALKRLAILLIDFIHSFSQSFLADTLIRSRCTFLLVKYG